MKLIIKPILKAECEKWQARIDHWNISNNYKLTIYLPNGDLYSDSWCNTIHSAKLIFAKFMEQRGIKWTDF
jgi:hypothetical protein